MRHERQEAAAGLYPVTEQGLLDRFNPKPQSSSLTSSNAEDHSQTQTEPLKPVVPDTVSDLENQTSANSPPPEAVDRGCTDALMGLMGRGRPLPSVGRGFLLQIPPPHIPKESTGDFKTPARMEMAPSCDTEDTMPQPGRHDMDVPEDICGLREEPFTSTPQHMSSSLSHSFRSFRYWRKPRGTSLTNVGCFSSCNFVEWPVDGRKYSVIAEVCLTCVVWEKSCLKKKMFPYLDFGLLKLVFLKARCLRCSC